jgi:hypothetical protein
MVYDLTAIDIRREITALRKSRDFSKGCVSPKRLFIFLVRMVKCVKAIQHLSTRVLVPFCARISRFERISTESLRSIRHRVDHYFTGLALLALQRPPERYPDANRFPNRNNLKTPRAIRPQNATDS